MKSSTTVKVDDPTGVRADTNPALPVPPTTTVTRPTVPVVPPPPTVNPPITPTTPTAPTPTVNPSRPVIPPSTPRNFVPDEKSGPKLDWDYTMHGFDWPDENEGVCTGLNQSPINLITPENAGFATAQILVVDS